MSLASDLSSLLSGLGDTASDVAVNLRASNVSGVRNTARFLNPIVRYCQSWLRRDDHSLDITQPGTLRIAFPDDSTLEVPLPPAVQEFLTAFNNGQHRDLELPAT
jgi:hypothetical protein